MNRLSRIFQPLTIKPRNAEILNLEGLSCSQKLMMNMGIIKPSNPGCYHLLPLGIRSIEKLTKLIELEMKTIDGQKIEMPLLTSAQLWQKTGRYQSVTSELFVVNDRHSKELIINPTNEESITDLISSVSPISHRQLPLRLYQITNKFRDEMKPRFGLLRSRQFLMKDLYSFDSNIDNAKHTYNEICQSYDRIFQKIGIDFLKVQASTGTIGGTSSHEYHFMSPIGEDQIIVCNKCKYACNQELIAVDQKICTKCGENDNFQILNGIEVGHTFLLGDRFSKPLDATYLSNEGKPKHLQMGCFGLGLSRILAATLEILSENDQLRWPRILSPYTLIIIGPKEGSKEQTKIQNLPEELYNTLNAVPTIHEDILIDDRNNMTIGKRLLEAKRVGYPFILVIGKKSLEDIPEFELHDLVNKTEHSFSESALIDFLLD
ncbi:probable proline--tRNA ligase, mitochondrial [Chrysoperla carnea]|uniref:probable proline--tRNA ligase, mitochondrial n=1 Tax=Chrysoperla carnea TaxID=189513 RepID=UPI001D08A02F|nr:probable proline--tRNA ligase, mitochondrial [Chrysoperla carnea]